MPFSTNLSQTAEIKANLFVWSRDSFVLRKSNRRNLMISQKRFLPMVSGKKDTPQFLSQNSRMGRFFPHNAPRTHSKEIKAFSSLSGSFHSSLFFTPWASASVHCWTWVSIALSTNSSIALSGLSNMRLAYRVRPLLSVSTFWACSLPLDSKQNSMYSHFVQSLATNPISEVFAASPSPSASAAVIVSLLPLQSWPVDLMQNQFAPGYQYQSLNPIHFPCRPSLVWICRPLI